jgi:hypothetical protein
MILSSMILSPPVLSRVFPVLSSYEFNQLRFEVKIRLTIFPSIADVS